MARHGVWWLGGGTVAVAVAVLVWLLGLPRPDPVMPGAQVPASVQAPVPGPVASNGGAAGTGGAVVADQVVADQVAQTSPVAVASDPAPAADPAPEPVAAAAPVLSLDIVRVTRDGAALVAGGAVPGAAVMLRVDGALVAETAADPAGQFVAMFTLEPADGPQVLTLEMQDAEGGVILSGDTVILSPRPAPVTLAEAAPPRPAAAGSVPAAPEPAVAEPAVTDAVPAPAIARPEPMGTVPDAETVALAAAPADEAATVATGQEGAGQESTAPETPGVPAPGPVLATAQPDDMPTAILLRGDGEVRILDRRPTVMDNVVIDAISYSDRGDVQISGRAARSDPQADLRLYLDNTPIAVARAEGGDWRLDLPSIDPGVYVLRVDQLNPEGRVVSRFETPFQRETPERVAAAQALAAQSAALAEPAAPEAGAAEPAAAEPAAPAPAVSAPIAPAAEIAVAQPAAPEPAAPEPAAPEPAPAQSAAALEPVSAEPTPAEPVASEPVVALAVASDPAPAEPAAESGAEPAATPSAPATPRIEVVTVQPGHTLWHISRQRYGAGERYVLIYRANESQIRNPDLIYPGQIFTLPEE